MFTSDVYVAASLAVMEPGKLKSAEFGDILEKYQNFLQKYLTLFKKRCIIRMVTIFVNLVIYCN